MRDGTAVFVGAGLKMYLGYRQSLEWFDGVAAVAARHPAVASGAVEVLVLPTFPLLREAVLALSPLGVRVGAQDLFWEDRGAYTGEVSGAELAEIGCSFVEIGHAERRRIFAETDEVVSAKAAAAYRNGLTPVVCVGELAPGEPAEAAAECTRQLRAALVQSRRSGLSGPLVVAYEPVWAIGATAPAGSGHIQSVCAALRAELDGDSSTAASRIVYGGSAGPGILSRLGGAADGLFLSRSAHDPRGLAAIVDEAAAFAGR